MSELKLLQDKVTARLQAIVSMRGGHSLTNGEGDKLWSTKAEVNLSSLARHAIHEVEKHYERTPDTSAKVDVVKEARNAANELRLASETRVMGNLYAPIMTEEEAHFVLHKLRRRGYVIAALQAPRNDTSAMVDVGMQRTAAENHAFQNVLERMKMSEKYRDIWSNDFIVIDVLLREAALQAPHSDTSANMYTNSPVSIPIEEPCIQTSAVELVREGVKVLLEEMSYKHTDCKCRQCVFITKSEQWLKKQGA